VKYGLFTCAAHIHSIFPKILLNGIEIGLGESSNKFFMNKKILSLFMGLAVLTASCKKDSTVVDVVNPDQSQMAVPANFTWQTLRDVNLSLGVTDNRFQDNIHVIQIYLEDPSSGAKPISTGSATLVTPFNVRLSIPSELKEVYVTKTAPDGSKMNEKVALTSENVSHALSAVKINSKLSATNEVTTITEPGCGISTTNTNINIDKSSDIVCFSSATDVRIDVTANTGGTLKLSAPGKTITLGNFNHTNIKLFIASGTTVKWTNDLNISQGETYVNNGTLDGTKINLAGVLINNKNILTSDFTLNSTGEFNNYCSLAVSGSLIIDEEVNNYKLITAGTTRVNSTGVVNLYNSAQFQTNTFHTMDGIVEGIGTTSLFKTVTTTESPVYDNTSGKFIGNLQYCGDKQLNDNQNKVNHFYEGAIQSCGLYIVKDDCNKIGNGLPSVITKPDRDKDGVIDELDEYPDDSRKAYNNYSCNYFDGGSTLAFEDNWPSEGDYDMNDVVLTYKHLAVTNAKNIIVRVEGEYNLIASGGEFSNGVGVMFNLPKNNATDFVSSNNLKPENGQDSLVVTLFKDTRAEQQHWNTIQGEPTSPTTKTTFSFNVLNGPHIKTIGIGGYNPFIWNNSSESGRGHETHLRGKNPTKLADLTLFNTKDDASAAGKNYSTAANHPWVLELPISNFQYPTERSNIKDAYLKYADWATSGGTNSVDWYKLSKEGNRNNQLIYRRK
jgi:LruC domain-containing protein